MSTATILLSLPRVFMACYGVIFNFTFYVYLFRNQYCLLGLLHPVDRFTTPFRNFGARFPVGPAQHQTRS